MRLNYLLAQCCRVAAALLLLLLLGACAASSLNFAKQLTNQPAGIQTDFVEVMSYAERSEAAYASPEIIRQRFPQTIRVAVPENTKVQYFLEMSAEEKTQTISIRGTANFIDVLLDAETVIEESVSLGIPVHTGFQRLALRVYDDVKPYLHKDYKTRLTGHSLGAAVAAILILYLQDDGYTVDRAINFGQPKFTTALGAKRFKDIPLLRVVDSDDVVPLLPPRLLRDPLHGPYEHLGEEVILLGGTSFIQLNKHDSSLVSVDSFWRNIRHASLKDHKMKRYLMRIAPKQSDAQQVDYVTWRESERKRSPQLQ
ncbi:lipase family protein [Pararhizobium sp. IMCC21322]|uniref:lipase family protein n=1 Tax=Pararhizobium sp. IMCC21322 TaxID=3067903 RepID=UPI0027417226|nr:lipase family protein [Pararhizobium sp. IMCC21322]